MPLASFFILECVEVVDLMGKMRDRIEYEHRLQYVALTNAIGGALNKNYKYKDLFKVDNSKREVTEEEKEDIKAYFENW